MRSNHHTHRGKVARCGIPQEEISTFSWVCCNVQPPPRTRSPKVTKVRVRCQRVFCQKRCVLFLPVWLLVSRSVCACILFRPCWIREFLPTTLHNRSALLCDFARSNAFPTNANSSTSMSSLKPSYSRIYILFNPHFLAQACSNIMITALLHHVINPVTNLSQLIVRPVTKNAWHHLAPFIRHICIAGSNPTLVADLSFALCSLHPITFGSDPRGEYRGGVHLD